LKGGKRVKDLGSPVSLLKIMKTGMENHSVRDEIFLFRPRRAVFDFTELFL